MARCGRMDITEITDIVRIQSSCFGRFCSPDRLASLVWTASARSLHLRQEAGSRWGAAWPVVPGAPSKTCPVRLPKAAMMAWCCRDMTFGGRGGRADGAEPMGQSRWGRAGCKGLFYPRSFLLLDETRHKAADGGMGESL